MKFSGRLLAVLFAVFVSACNQSGPDFLQEGRSFLEKGELSSAVIAFKNAVQANGSSADTRFALADALERTGDLNGAEQHYRRALELGGDADSLVPRIALILLDRGDFAGFVREFADKELPAPSSDSELRGLVALAHLGLGQKAAAEAQLARAQSESPAIRLARAQMAVKADQPSEALDHLEPLIREGKAPWWVLRSVGRMYQALGDKDKALSAMKSAYEAAGMHPNVIGEYAELLFETGNSGEVKPLRDKLQKIAPRYYRTVLLNALLLMEEGKADPAHEMAMVVLNAQPGNVAALTIAAKVELDRGELDSAESHIKKILSKRPASVPVLQMQFALELRRGDAKAATSVLERAVLAAPNDRQVLAAEAELAWTKGDKARALASMGRAVRMDPPLASLNMRLAQMQYAAGKKADAEDSIAQALRLSENDVRQREQIFGTLLRMGQLVRARQVAQAEMERRPVDAEPHFWLAAVLAGEGKEDAALKQIELSLDVRPDYYEALQTLRSGARTPERLRDFDARLQKAVDQGSKDVRIYLDRARRLKATGADTDQVGAVLARGIAADPLSVTLREWAINHWLAAGQKEKAVALATDGESVAKDNVRLKLLSAVTHEAVGNYEAAIAKYVELEALAPERVDWVARHVQVLVRTGKAGEATSLLRKLISARPDESAPFRMLAMIQVDQKQVTEALAVAEMLIGRQKHRAAGLLLRGDIYLRAGDKDEALKAYADAARAGAEEEAVLRKVDLLDRSGSETLADGTLRDWLSAHPKSVAALIVAARRESTRQDFAAAARYLESLASLKPANPVFLNDLAWAYAQMRNPKALETARRAIALSPEDPRILDTLAEALTLAGKRTEAIASLRLAISLSPPNPAFKIHLAELLVEEGNSSGARTLLEGIETASLDKDVKLRLERVRQRL